MMMKATGAIVLLILLASCVSAYSLAVKVTVSQDTPAFGTNVSLVTGGVELATQKALNTTRQMDDAVATFDVNPGSYFVLLRRGGYPMHVTLISVDSDKNVTLSMSQAISYASAYGQIGGPSDFSNTTITAYSGGAIVKKTAANRDGFYMLSFVPGGNYELQFSSPGFEPKSLQVFLPTADFTEVDAKLEKPAKPQEQPPKLSAPTQAQQFSVIEASLFQGGSPLAGKDVSVETPSGRFSLTTDPDGKVRINAAEGGTYRFSYGNLSSSTEVTAKEAAQPPQVVKNETLPVAQPAQPPAQPSSSGALPLLAVAIFIAGGLMLVAIVVLAVWWFLEGRGKRGGHKHDHPRKK